MPRGRKGSKMDVYSRRARRWAARLAAVGLSTLIGAAPTGGADSAKPRPARVVLASWHHELTLTHQEPVSDPSLIYADDKGTITAAALASFLRRQRSPMAPFAPDIIRAANTHGADPRIVVAIAGEESGYGRVCRGYNAWGWDGGRYRWKSWPESIDAYSRLLATRYPNHRDYRRIARRYNPPSPEGWAAKVALHLRWLEADLRSA